MSECSAILIEMSNTSMWRSDELIGFQCDCADEK